MTQPPQNVMRFYGNVQYALECIALKQITFLHVDKINDPFDPNMLFETNFNADYQALINHVQQHHPKDILEFKKRLPKQRWNGFIEEMENLSNNLRNSLFIFSTSKVSANHESKNNMYMWSHYGNGHRGVAIEFDTALLAKAVLKQSQKSGGETAEINEIWTEIKYQDELLKITCEHIFNFVINDTPIINEQAWLKAELANVIRERASLKSLGWNIEEEWRLMWKNDETKLKFYRVDLLDDTINAIYLSFRYPLIDDHINDDLIFEMRRNFPNVGIFKATKGKGKSALDFKRIAVPANTKLTENRKQKTENRHVKNP
jgi:hypothetical protein